MQAFGSVRGRDRVAKRERASTPRRDATETRRVRSDAVCFDRRNPLAPARYKTSARHKRRRRPKTAEPGFGLGALPAAGPCAAATGATRNGNATRHRRRSAHVTEPDGGKALSACAAGNGRASSIDKGSGEKSEGSSPTNCFNDGNSRGLASVAGCDALPAATSDGAWRKWRNRGPPRRRARRVHSVCQGRERTKATSSAPTLCSVCPSTSTRPWNAPVETTSSLI